mmetsp:Transcript_40596/g.114974  ORF Transcript_40596/g.114974 Transcript_40596/m.114974 type:complete len:710 (-) Transcript_40596:208-2337(-)
MEFPTSPRLPKSDSLSEKIKNGTLAMGNTVSNLLSMPVPQLAGAIDVLAVRQPDGTLKCSPFYVRFGKYQVHLHRRSKDVAIVVNGKVADFGMRLSSTGEAYFAVDTSDAGRTPDQSEPELAAARSPPCGCSDSGEEGQDAGGTLPWPKSTGHIAGGADTAAADAVEVPAEPSGRRPSLERRASNPGAEPSGELMGGELSLPGGGRRAAGMRQGKLSLVAKGFRRRSSSESPSSEQMAPASSSSPSCERVSSFKRHGSEGAADTGYLGDCEGSKAADRRVWTEVSLCKALLHDEMSAEEADAVFDEHRVRLEDFVGPEGGAVAEAGDVEELMVRGPDGIIYPWEVAAPGLLAGSTEAEGGADEDTDKLGSSPKSGSWSLWPSYLHVGGQRAESDRADGSGGSQQSSAANLRTAAAEVAAGTTTVSAAERALHHMDSSSSGVGEGRRALVPTVEQLESLGLQEGQNKVEFVLNQHIFAEYRLHAYVYLVRWNSFLVVSDVDGTITRSDVLGHLLPPMGLDWSHSGVASLLSDIKANNYTVMFLSSRAISQASLTRDFLLSLKQDGRQLPAGPVLISPDGLLPSLYREVVVRRPHEFKIATLQAVRGLFPDYWNPFYAGFGNRGTDEVSYKAVGIPPGRIFTINPKGEIRRSTGVVLGSLLASLGGINALVDEVFPPIEDSAGEHCAPRVRVQQRGVMAQYRSRYSFAANP